MNEMKHPAPYTSPNNNHPDEETLDQFVMGRLNPEQMKALQLHLEECTRCQAFAMDTGEFIQNLRSAAEMEKSEEKYQVSPQNSPAFLSRWSLEIAAALAILIAIPFFWPADPEVQTVEVSSLRGSETLHESFARAGQSFYLTTSLTGLPENDCCQLDIIDSQGKRISLQQATRNEGKGTILSPALPSGSYWVRIRTNQGVPLREMSLSVR